MLHSLAGQLLAVHREHAGATLAEAGSVKFKVEYNRVLARLERIAEEVAAANTTFPTVTLKIEKVVNEDRLAFEQIETRSRRSDRPGDIRSQFHHIIDIVPTILEATGIQAPQLSMALAEAD